mmetsp:Transcript_32346/g.51799  ORF Transcript_32346/g.51799 Transcript_32346/m.51799 type:complete len:203 (+) Transcript_32346:3-611(+)
MKTTATVGERTTTAAPVGQPVNAVSSPKQSPARISRSVAAGIVELPPTGPDSTATITAPSDSLPLVLPTAPTGAPSDCFPLVYPPHVSPLVAPAAAAALAPLRDRRRRCRRRGLCRCRLIPATTAAVTRNGGRRGEPHRRGRACGGGGGGARYLRMRQRESSLPADRRTAATRRRRRARTRTRARPVPARCRRRTRRRRGCR